MERRRKGTSRTVRLVWGGVALLLAVGLGISFILARNALHDEERSAQIRAGFLTTSVLSKALTPSMVSGPITGGSYRDLLVVVQQQILSDDRMFRVRVWQPDGTLIFSTDQRDRIGQTFGAIEEKIGPAIEGETFSEVSDGPVAPKVGLSGSTESLFQTFVPLHIDTRLGVMGAVQIEQRYSLIRSAAIGMWRLVQIGLTVALAVAIVLLALSLRPRTVGRVAGFEPASAGASEKALRAEAREVQDHLRRAEEATRQAQARLAASEEKVQEFAASSRALELKLREAEDRIPELEAELARTGEELRRLMERPVPEPPTPEIQVELQKSYSRLQQLETELQEAGERKALAEQRASQAEAQLAEAEERVRVVEAERAATAAELAQAAASAPSPEDVLALEGRLRLAEEGLAARTAELEGVAGQLRDLEERLRLAEERAARAGARASEAEERTVVLDEEVASAEQRAARADSRAAEAEDRAATIEAERAAAAGQAHDDDGDKKGKGKRAQAELRRVEEELQATTARLEELQALVQQSERDRQRLAGELFETQEKLANRDFELAQAASRLEELQAARAEPAGEERAVPEGVSPLRSRLPRPTEAPEAAPPSEAEAASEPEVEEGGLAPEAESLRSRLTKAAAMRHGAPTPPPPPGPKGRRSR